MRICSVLAAMLATLSVAQTLAAPQGQQDLLVVDHSWRRYSRDVSLKVPPPSGVNNPSQNLSIPPPHAPIFVTEYAYTLKLKNVGARTIRVVGWDYIFTDPTTRQELGRHHFQSVVKMGQGAQTTVVHSTPSPPTRIVTASILKHDARNPFTERILITCLKYNDGSVWIADSSREKGCQTPTVRRH